MWKKSWISALDSSPLLYLATYTYYFEKIQVPTSKAGALFCVLSRCESIVRFYPYSYWIFSLFEKDEKFINHLHFWLWQSFLLKVAVSLFNADGFRVWISRHVQKMIVGTLHIENFLWYRVYYWESVNTFLCSFIKYFSHCCVIFFAKRCCFLWKGEGVSFFGPPCIWLM